MITRLEIENFKAIKKVAIELDPLTVLVGPNDSGKSTILQALDLLSRSLDRPTYRPGEASVFDREPAESIHGGDRSKNITLRAEEVLRDGGSSLDLTFAYEISFGFTKRVFGVVRESFAGLRGESVLDERYAEAPEYSYASRNNDGDWASLRNELSSFLVALEPKQLATPCRPDASFEPTGFGLAALVDRILTDTDRAARDEYERALGSFSPHVASVGTRPVEGQLKELVFGLKDKTRVPAREASAGLLATAGYLALMHLPARRFLIEEPENGLHPQALLNVADVLRGLPHKGRQVVMTTHSPILLNYIDAAHVRIVTRTTDEGVKVTPALQSKVFNKLRQKVDFGALWYSVGDDALASAQ